MDASIATQRGATGLFGVLVLGLFLSFVVLAVDTGRLALEKRRLQKVADLAALEALQHAGLCNGGGAVDPAALRAAAQTSAMRNGYRGDLAAESGAVLFGRVYTDADGIRHFLPSEDARPLAVQVTARDQVARSLVAGGWYRGGVALQAVGVAQQAVIAGFWLGSSLATVDSADASVLNGVITSLLGSSVSLDAVSYQGLANADITIGQLISGAQLAGISLRANSVRGLLDTELDIADFLSVVASALSEGEQETAAVAVNQMRWAASPGGTIRIGDVIGITAEDPEAYAVSSINAYALGMATLQLARQGQTLVVPLSATLPLGGTVNLSLHVVEAPQIAIGPPGRDGDGEWMTSARTAQANLQFDVVLPPIDIVPGVTASAQLAIVAEAAQAEAWLESVRCASINQPVHQVVIEARAGLSELALGRFDDISASPPSMHPMAPITITALSLTANVGVSAEVDVQPEYSDRLLFDIASGALPSQQSVGVPVATSVGNSMQSLMSSLELSIESEVGIPLPGLTPDDLADAVRTEILTPIFASVDEAVLDPVFRGLGLSLGGADIEVFSMEAGRPRLMR